MADVLHVGMIGCGMMGAAIGRILVAHGAQVVALTEGRSTATGRRAIAAGMQTGTRARIAACDIVLSVVPPEQARPAAEDLLRAAGEIATAPLYVDCNAIHPDDARALDRRFETAGWRFVDAGIIGAPPRTDGSQPPLFYASGPNAASFERLRPYGIRIETLVAPAGAASALKMALAAVSKGMTGLLIQALMIAEEAEVRDALIAALGRSHPGLLAWGERQLPHLAHKAPRWEEEMAVLIRLAAGKPGGAEFFEGLGDLFAAVGVAVPEERIAGWTHAITTRTTRP